LVECYGSVFSVKPPEPGAGLRLQQLHLEPLIRIVGQEGAPSKNLPALLRCRVRTLIAAQPVVNDLLRLRTMMSPRILILIVLDDLVEVHGRGAEGFPESDYTRNAGKLGQVLVDR
jgi:hypothetical protein